MSNTPDQTGPQASGSDAGRGNLDGTTAVNAPREKSLDDAKSASQAHGNGSFDEAPEPDGADDTAATQTAADSGDSGQDNGSMS